MLNVNQVSTPMEYGVKLSKNDLYGQKELQLPQKEPTKIMTDNKSALALAKNPVFHDRKDLEDYSDSDYGGYIDSRKSTTVYVFMVADGALSWRSVKQTLISNSIMEAEFMSCYEATSHGVWLKGFISGLRVVDSIIRPIRNVLKKRK
uniref:Uncharacterized protein n=1 Tax=Chenopodium quinoa TaxID=63459 RepID=A0A803MKJ3_CHEQI